MRRAARTAPGGREEITAALQATADASGCAVERLRMLDYQHAAERDPALPDLSSVLATYSTWKAARSAAAVAAGGEVGEALRTQGSDGSAAASVA